MAQLSGAAYRYDYLAGTYGEWTADHVPEWMAPRGASAKFRGRLRKLAEIFKKKDIPIYQFRNEAVQAWAALRDEAEDAIYRGDPWGEAAAKVAAGARTRIEKEAEWRLQGLKLRADQAADDLRNSSRPEVDALTRSYRAELRTAARLAGLT
jgi:hypothetical protein